MCVAIAIKLPRDKETGRPTKDSKWVLVKIRDRTYIPNYKLRPYNDGRSTSLFIIDDHSDWSECIKVGNESKEVELMFVNTALNNSVDKVNGTEVRGLNDGKIARRASKAKTLEEATQAIIEGKMEGCTFISNGDRCVLVEHSLSSEAKTKHRDALENGEILTNICDIDEFITSTDEITETTVRTNHGVSTKSGYSSKDGVNFNSSKRRKELAEKYFNEYVYSVEDIPMVIELLGTNECGRNPYLRPRRVRQEIAKLNVPQIFTTSAFIFSPTKSYILLFDSEITNNTGRILRSEFPVKLNILRY